MSRYHLDRHDARAILSRVGIDPATDFFALPASKVGELIGEADARRYRKPRQANGSRGRYFYAYLQRAAYRED